jgi:hypothetical protein
VVFSVAYLLARRLLGCLPIGEVREVLGNLAKAHLIDRAT